MHVDHELVEFMPIDKQDYEEVIAEYEEEILMQKGAPEPFGADFADPPPAQGKPRCITPTVCSLNYICALSFKELNETHLHIYIYLYPMSLTSMTGSCRLLCYRTPVEVE